MFCTVGTIDRYILSHEPWELCSKLGEDLREEMLFKVEKLKQNILCEAIETKDPKLIEIGRQIIIDDEIHSIHSRRVDINMSTQVRLKYRKLKRDRIIWNEMEKRKKLMQQNQMEQKLEKPDDLTEPFLQITRKMIEDDKREIEEHRQKSVL